MSQSFGAEVDAYDRARPDYPRDAVHWLLGDAHRVADVGAGTGKLSAVIAELGREVIAIEPDDAMRSMCRRRLPDIEVFDGSGEHLPLPDSSVDAVTFGQAWHWVDPQLACAEAARVLRPDGVLALMWNVRDQTVDWVDQLTTVANAQNGEGLALVNPPAFTAPFQRAENQRWSWTRDITPQELVDLMVSRTSVITADSQTRAEIINGVRHLLATHPGTADRQVLQLPYVTTAWKLQP